MKISVITVGKKLPKWIQAGVDEYSKRLDREYELKFVEVVSSLSGSAADKNLRIQREGVAILGKTQVQDYVISLDETGARVSTLKFASKLEFFKSQGKNIVFLIGGADGLHKSCLERSQETWSLSDLTFPHALVRVVLIEQLYRAHSILNGHPYHRE